MSSKIIKSHSVSCELLRVALSSGGFIYISGAIGIGKTTLAITLLEESKDSIYAYIDCNQVATSSKLYIEIFKRLAVAAGSRKLKYKIPDKIWSWIDFYDTLVKFISNLKSLRVFIVLDQVEVLKKTPLVESVINLTKIPNISIIFISCLIPQELTDIFRVHSRSASTLHKLNVIQLKSWDKSEIFEIIIQQKPRTSNDLYVRFVQTIVSIVYATSTKNFTEIRTFCQEEFPKFLEYYQDKIKEKIKFHDNLDSEFIVDQELIEEFKISNAVTTKIITSYLESLRVAVRQNLRGIRAWNSQERDPKVVYSTSFLIIAVYIAANTKISDNKKNFVKFHRRKLTKRAKVCDENIVAKNFTLERILQVHKSLTQLAEGLSGPNRLAFLDSTLADVQMLENLNIIQLVSGDGLDSSSRYKISEQITRAYVSRLSKQIDFPLESICGL